MKRALLGLIIFIVQSCKCESVMGFADKDFSD